MEPMEQDLFEGSEPITAVVPAPDDDATVHAESAEEIPARPVPTFVPGVRYAMFLKTWGPRAVYVEMADPPVIRPNTEGIFLRVRFYQTGEGYLPEIGLVSLEEVWMMQPWDQIKVDVQRFIAQRGIVGR